MNNPLSVEEAEKTLLMPGSGEPDAELPINETPRECIEARRNISEDLATIKFSLMCCKISLPSEEREDKSLNDIRGKIISLNNDINNLAATIPLSALLQLQRLTEKVALLKTEVRKLKDDIPETLRALRKAEIISRASKKIKVIASIGRKQINLSIPRDQLIDNLGALNKSAILETLKNIITKTSDDSRDLPSTPRGTHKLNPSKIENITLNIESFKYPAIDKKSRAADDLCFFQSKNIAEISKHLAVVTEIKLNAVFHANPKNSLQRQCFFNTQGAQLKKCLKSKN